METIVEITQIHGRSVTVVTNLDCLGYAEALYADGLYAELGAAEDLYGDMNDVIVALAGWLARHRDQWTPARWAVPGAHPNLGWREDPEGEGDLDPWEIGPEAVAAMVAAVTAA